MLFVISSNYYLFAKYMSLHYNKGARYIVFIPRENYPFYKKNMSIDNLMKSNIDLKELEQIKILKYKFFAEQLVILDLLFKDYVYYIRHFSNYIEQIYVFRTMDVNKNGTLLHNNNIIDQISPKMLKLFNYYNIKYDLFNDFVFYKKRCIDNWFFR